MAFLFEVTGFDSDILLVGFSTQKFYSFEFLFLNKLPQSEAINCTIAWRANRS